MKVALISDQHTNLRSRQEECWRVLTWIFGDLRARGVDLILLGGDLAEGPWTAAEEDRAAEWLLDLADVAPVVGVTGNHDLGSLGTPRRRLAVDQLQGARHPIVIVDRPQVVRAAGVAVACLPWPRGGHLLAAVGDAGREQRYQAGIEALRACLGGLGAELAQHDGPRVLLSHCHVRGVKLGAHIPDRVDFEVGVEDLALAGADFVGLGHIHKHQAWSWSIEGREMPVVYPGSPYRCSFGETEAKGYVVADFNDSRLRQDLGLIGWEFIPTPATPMVLATGRFETRDGVAAVDHDHAREAVPPGAEIRLRYKVTSDQADAGKRAAEAERDRLLAEGAASVVLEPEIEPVTRARAPEITGKVTPADKLEVWLRGQGVDDSRVERLRGMVASLEVESQ